MRPEPLFPLFAPVTSLKGVGPRIAKFIERLAGPHVIDVLWHLPNGMIDRRHSPSIANAPDGAIITIVVTVDQHHPPRNKRQPYKVTCSDGTGSLSLVFFHARPDYLLRILPEGEKRAISGRVEHFGGEAQMPHPDHIESVEKLESLKTIEPVYPLTAGLAPKVLRKAIDSAIETVPTLNDWLDPAYREKNGWSNWRDALLSAHRPSSPTDLTPLSPARMRLAYDELLANQLALALVRHNMRRLSGRPQAGNGKIRNMVRQNLPFSLTASQETSLTEIEADMASGDRMLRLLQGDVGSGKTVVALLSMLVAVEDGAQAALMAPTEILARQHFASIETLLQGTGVRLAILTGREKGKARQAIIDGLHEGEIDIAIGTHALFQEGVAFRDLGMAVVDEQHRFGVHQRITLAAKGKAPDVLVMTATPIPRTLVLTAYGDLDVSRLTEKPAGRQPIDTRALPLDRIAEVIGGIKRAAQDGARIYWVCPLVEESETLDVAAVEDRHRQLAEIFGDRVGLVHGRMKGPEKDAAMEAFATGKTVVLVATTVIEVGVDVPEATIMVIEHAERFGLAQLHQLRGRVGRGAERSSCLLLYASPLGETAKSRISIMRETDDGFRIAEEDLRLRGAGELLGTRQSGIPEFRMADLAHHQDLLATARDDAALVLSRDPDLQTARGKTLRLLLYLFERDAAIRFLRSG
ncbi:MAG: ATP-dependent DNA helicase RecG [Rhodospirillales bacterium]|nr:ATP-dependent DNA helicase RecG [Rhodospirillales bacterium]MCW8970038.1 ATP-dependent DNA helicase RecG [Rhodospirillales bacterium]